MYQEWEKNPSSVHSSWDSYFRLVSGKRSDSLVSSSDSTTEFTRDTGMTDAQATIEDHFSVARIIRSYQRKGHFLADLDPLEIQRGPFIKLKEYKNPVLADIQLPSNPNASYKLPDFTYIGGPKNELTLKEIVERLEKIYCGTIGVEFTHVPLKSQSEFLKMYFENPGQFPELTKDEKIRALKKLYSAYLFEMFLAKKWPSEKRFGIDGAEEVIPALAYLTEMGSDVGANAYVIGMAHRGRLNVLANIIKMDISQILTQFQGLPPDSDAAGDVKYHLGTTVNIKHPITQKPIRLSLVSNASHLESAAAIVEGKAAAEQIFLEGNDKSKVWPILIHGDAAMSGQGIVYETIHLSELNCFKTGGTIHIVINNQIGFTTDPHLSRSSEYCTSVGKVNDSPIFHVNGNDIENVLKVMKIAAEYRAKFQTDVVIDIVSYRRLGHNEVDEPMFTQPVMYKKIKQMKPVNYLYADKLIKEKVITPEEVKNMADAYEKFLEDGYQEAMKNKKLISSSWIDSPWPGFFSQKKDQLEIPITGVKSEILLKIGEAISTPPANFNLHKGLERIFSIRNKNIANNIIDWACGESFAFASLLQEGIYVRLSGQDVERGTFSHRHHVLHDQKVPDKRINVLENIFPNQAMYMLCNSSLCEFGVLGFEIGVSLVNPYALVMWEAQFGDFCNSAQILMDQYLSSGEVKWIRQAGVVLLLPHGMEGMGPEHSSARIERFLQMCNDDDSEATTDMPKQMKQSNWFICNASTPASFFHLLRRQVKLNYRKPLIIFTPKFLLRYPQCVSPLSEFTGDTKFKPYLPDPDVPPSKDVSKLLLCSGKVYYELKEARSKAGLENKIAVGRLEQISPVPYNDIIKDANVTFVAEQQVPQLHSNAIYRLPSV
ncbi:2-oxoglutarate dehydrogenase, mitochondrial-like [Lycorma delicatula]|uniref:2-oxoglutarate dehydrogenase, mitochondrial-like n=1 Tax=Lycorma delicatula TaxID=130591 RepID=UPI003F5130D2